MKRKWIIFCLLLALCAVSFKAQPAQGAEVALSQRWAKGGVQAVDTVDIFAPVGGQVQAFDVKVGDVVDVDSPLITIRPLQVLAPENGVIRLLKVQVGDQASNVILQYGALCSIDREDVWWVRATIATAYDKPKNRALTLGETLRVYDGDSNDPLDTLGTVIAVEGRGYVVEIPAGVFELEDKVRLYRGDGDTYNAKDKVGEGVVERAKTIPVMAEGVIAKIHVSEGQQISRGDVLFTLDDASSVHNSPVLFDAVPSRGGVVSALYVQDGQQVATALTDAYGYYLFDNVYPMMSQVHVTMYPELAPATQRTDYPLLVNALAGIQGDTAYTGDVMVTSGGQNFDCDLGFVLKDGSKLPDTMLPPPKQIWD